MKYSLVLGSLLLTAPASLGQNLLGISTSRYGGTNPTYINPAFAADAPNVLSLNVGAVSAHVDNNYVRYQAPFSLLRLLTGTVPAAYKNADGSANFQTNYTQEILDGRPKNGTIWAEVRGPSLLVRAGDRWAIGLTTRLRAAAQVIGASPSLLSSVRAGLGDGALLIPGQGTRFNANTNTYGELGLTLARTIWDDGAGRRLSLGGSAKLLVGYTAQHILNRGLDYTIVGDNSSAYLQVSRLDATIGSANFLQNRSLSPKTLLDPNSPGRGFGFDVGLSYVSQPDADGPSLRLGAAITDLGGLYYKGSAYDYAVANRNDGSAGPDGIRFFSADFNNSKGTGRILDVIQQRLAPARGPDKGSLSLGLPTSLNLTADYGLPQGLGLSLTYLRNLRSADAASIRQPTLLAATPRYESRSFSVAVPVTYLNQGLMVGAALRIGPAWLGTDNLAGLIGSSRNGIRPRGTDVYAGLTFGIGRKNAARQ